MSREQRIPPLPPEERDERTAELLAVMRSDDHGGDMNLTATLARHPRLLKRWTGFAGLLLFGGALPDQDRELLILRTAANTGADYEWGHHVAIGLAVGLDEDQIARVVEGPGADGWTEHQRLLLRAADELHRTSDLSDEVWDGLAASYDDAQMIEVPMLVGQYHLVGFTLNALRIQREPGFEGIPRS